MDHAVGDVSLFAVEQGEGFPVLALHGAGVDHREVMACLEPVFEGLAGYRRIYPDLPGMGRTPAPETIRSADDVLDVLLGFVDGVVGDQPLLVVGHSAGGYFAQAIARPASGPGSRPRGALPSAAGHPRPARPRRTCSGPSTSVTTSSATTSGCGRPRPLERYERYVAPAALLADESALERIGERWELTARPVDAVPYGCPTLVVTGRQDSTVGYAAAWDLLEHYPRATFAVLDRAGHALPHEQPELLRALVTEWLDRVHAA